MPHPSSTDFCLAPPLEVARDALETLVGVRPEARIAWPTVHEGHTDAWTGPCVCVEATCTAWPPDGALLAWLELSLAGALVDRLLGGSGATAFVHSSLALSEAEQGVLAYLATRLFSVLGSGRVIGVKAHPSLRLTAPSLVLPISIALGAQNSALHLAWSLGHLPDALAAPTSTLRVDFAEALAEHDAAALSPGDLLLLESNVHANTEGIAPLRASLDGLSEALPARIERGRVVRASGALLRSRPHEICLEVHAPRVSIEQAARFHAGGSIPGPDAAQLVRVRRADEVLAEGELVHYRHQPAVRIVSA